MEGQPSCTLKTACGTEFIVPENYALQYRHATFRLDRDGYTVRAISLTRRRFDIPVHIEVLGRRKNYMIDHIDRNRLNNSLDNLRHISQAQNNQNRRALARKKYKCVTWEPETGKFRVRITAFNVKISAGRFTDETEAVAVSNIYLDEFHGKVAVLNPTNHLESYDAKLAELKNRPDFRWRLETHKMRYRKRREEVNA